VTKNAEGSPSRQRGRPKKDANAPLNAKQQRFVDEYLKDLNGTRAYLRAGYKATPASATANANKLLRNDHVRAAVQAAKVERRERTKMEADEALEGITLIARADVRQIFDEHGELRDVHTLDDRTARCIKAIKIVTKKRGKEIVQVREIVFYDALRALEYMGKHHGALREHHEHSASVSVLDEHASDRELVARIKVLLAKAEDRMA